MSEIGLLGVFCGISVFIGLTASFNYIQTKYRHRNWLIAGLFLAVSLRVAKSIWYFVFFDVAPLGLAIGFLGLSSIGPISWLFLKNSRGKLRSFDLIHFALPFIGFLGAFLFSIDYVTIGYKLATVILLLYASVVFVIAHAQGLKEARLIAIGALFIGLCFVVQHLSESMLAYAWGAAIAGIILLFLSRRIGINDKNKSIKSGLSPQMVQLVVDAFQVDKVYLDKNLTLNALSNDIRVPTYLISKVVKKNYGRTFPETLNYFRIKEAKRILSAQLEFLKVEIVANEVGFKSVSAFYVAFKKHTGGSPTEYRKRILRTELKPTTLDLASS